MTKQKLTLRKPLLLSSVVVSMTLAGCAATPSTDTANDPWVGWNRGTQSFNDTLDSAVIKPLAQGYQWVTPQFVDDGVTNFFSNINDVGVTINDVLQFKMTQSGMDMGRFLINTTAGVGGLVDVASMISLPKHKEDFGQTLGYWGVPSGNYLVLPIFGPSSPRDTVGLVGDALFNPLTYISIFGGVAANAATAGAKVLDVTDQRAHLMTTEKILDEGAVDRYDFIKNSYQQNREFLIKDGNPSNDADPDLLDDNGTESAPQSQAPGTTSPANGSGSSPSEGAAGAAGSEESQKGHFLELSTPQ